MRKQEIETKSAGQRKWDGLLIACLSHRPWLVSYLPHPNARQKGGERQWRKRRFQFRINPRDPNEEIPC